MRNNERLIASLYEQEAAAGRKHDAVMKAMNDKIDLVKSEFQEQISEAIQEWTKIHDRIVEEEKGK